VKSVQKKMGAPTIPNRSFGEIAGVLAFPPGPELSGRELSKRSKQLRSGLKAPAPFDAYARFRLREVCREVVNRTRKSSTLRKLRKELKDDDECVRMIDAALAR
jgi:hypothetical protein